MMMGILVMLCFLSIALAFADYFLRPLPKRHPSTCDADCGPISQAEMDDCYDNGYYYTSPYAHSQECRRRDIEASRQRYINRQFQEGS